MANEAGNKKLTKSHINVEAQYEKTETWLARPTSEDIQKKSI